MRKKNRCDGNCFECKFDDCIVSYRDILLIHENKNYQELSNEEKEEYSKNLDNKHAEYLRKYQEKNRESYKEYMRNYMRDYRKKKKKESRDKTNG